MARGGDSSGNGWGFSSSSDDAHGRFERQNHVRAGRADVAVMRWFARHFAPTVSRLWPGELLGLEELPPHRDFIVIANHSGTGSAELLSLIDVWWRSFGDSRPLCGLAHPFGFRVPMLRYFLDGVGAMPATVEGAARARAEGVPLLLFPGGDHEATRPFWQARRVDFNGRTGWVRLARAHDLDVVPLCIEGSHNTNPVLAGGRAVAWLTGQRMLGLHRAPLTMLGLATGIFAYRAAGRRWGRGMGVAAGLAGLWSTTMIPWVPGKITFRFLPRITRSEIHAATDTQVYDQVTGALQGALAAS